MKSIKLKNWSLKFDGKTIPASVPGDITIDMFKAGIVKDPYYGFNYREKILITALIIGKTSG